MNIKIEYRQIKSMSIRILDSETILVRANPRYRKEEIMAFVEKKKPWIAKHQQRAQAIEATMEDGPNVFWLLGKKMQIVMQPSNQSAMQIKENQIVVYHEPNIESMHVFNREMTRYVQMILNKEVERCVGLFRNLNVPVIEIKQLKSKWGICYYNKGKIVLNAALIHPPLHCIDFVVVHELMHFYYPDHQAGFHQAMAKVMPKYKEYEKELRMYERFLRRKNAST